MSEQETHEAELEKEIKDALTLTDVERLLVRDKVEWKLRGIDNIIQQSLYEKCLPLFLKVRREIERLENKIDKLEQKVKK